jgi:hypothetical protein
MLRETDFAAVDSQFIRGANLARVAWTYILQSERLSYLVEYGLISHLASQHSTELSTGEAAPGVSHKGNGLRVACSWNRQAQVRRWRYLEQSGLD